MVFQSGQGARLLRRHTLPQLVLMHLPMLTNLAEDVLVLLFRFLCLEDTKALSLTATQFARSARRCSWLWHTMRVANPDMACCWNKRRREELPNMIDVLRVHGPTLHTLQLGAFSMCNFLFGNAHLNVIAKFVPNLKTLLIGFPFSNINTHGMALIAKGCTQLTTLALPLAVPAPHKLPSDDTPVPVSFTQLSNLQLHGYEFRMPRLETLGVSLQTITSLGLVNITMLDTLAPLAVCTALRSLQIRYCTSMNHHPEHLHEQLRYNAFLTKLQKLSLIECPTVVCMNTLLYDIAFSSDARRWNELELLELKQDEFLTAEREDVCLRCKDCTENPVHLGFYVKRCKLCLDDRRPALKELLARV